MGERAADGGPGVVAVAGEALIDFVPAGRNGLFEAAPGAARPTRPPGWPARRSRSGRWPGSPTTCSATASGPT